MSLQAADRTAGSDFLLDGIAVLSAFVTAAELGPLRAEVDRAVAAPLPPGCERPHNTLVPLRWNDRIVNRILGSTRRERALVDAVAANDLRWISGYVSIKEARSGPLWWHQDWWCWNHPVSYRRRAAQVAVLCYLSETCSDNGALRVLPGTHHRSVGLHAALPEAHADATGGPDDANAAMDDIDGQLTLELAAGDAVVIDYRLLHGTHANDTDERRDCLLMSFTPSWRELPHDLRAHLIRHPALPTNAERESANLRLLPSFDGTPRDLALNRVAPSDFAAVE